MWRRRICAFRDTRSVRKRNQAGTALCGPLRTERSAHEARSPGGRRTEHALNAQRGLRHVVLSPGVAPPSPRDAPRDPFIDQQKPAVNRAQRLPTACLVFSIPLKKVSGTVRGIYGPNKDQFGKRMAYFRDAPLPSGRSPIAIWEAIHMEFGNQIVLSDGYRTPKESVLARRAKAGTALPGFSGHNFGVSFDMAVRETMQRAEMGYVDLVEKLVALGATPFDGRNESPTAMESWHFNCLDLGEAGGTTGADVEKWITETYGHTLYLPEDDWRQIQEALSEFGFYPKEAVDGIPGPKTRAALDLLREACQLKRRQTGKGLQITSTERRVLASALATVEKKD